MYLTNILKSLDFVLQQATKRDNELLNQEKKNLAEQLEKRRAEIEKINGLYYLFRKS